MCTCKTKMSYSPRRLSNLWEESTKEWFREFLELVMNLKFQEVPDYDKYISLLDKIKNKILKDYQEPSPATEDPPAWISVYNYQQSMKQRYHYNIAWDNKVISRYIKKDLDEKLFICSATSHEKLALITMEKTGYTKQEYMILDLDKLKDIKLDENYTITALAATGERWLVTMAQGTTFPNQKFCVASDFFPEKFIAENRGSFVTALAANEEKWAVVLSQSPVVSSEEEQVIEFDFCIPMEGLHERFKQGYKISMVAASKNQIAFVLSRPVKKTDVRKNDTSKDATTKTSTNDSNKESAPAQDGGPEKVDEQEGKSMDRGKDATSKGARATCKISLIKSRDKTVFTTKYNAGSEQDGGSEEEPKQEIVFTKDFPKTSIKENWQKSMYVSSICYSRLEEKSFHAQQDLPSSGP